MLLSLVFLSSLATRVQVLLLLLIALLIAQLLLTVLLLIALLLIALLLLTLQRLIALRLNLSDKQKSLKLFPQGKQLSFLHPSPPPHLLHSRCNDLCEAPCGISDAEGANHIIT